jgi:GAF domain-containing protein
MLPFPVASLLPADETQRLRSLRAYHLLQAPPERVFAELVALSAHVFGLPVALLAIVEAQEVIYKATYGLPGLRVHPRAETFCALAIHQNKPVVFWDVAQAQHALLSEAALAAVRAKGIRFYAGAPLRLPDAQPLGTLCVLGYEPRPFHAGEQDLLEQLAQVLGQTMAARHTCLSNPGLGWGHWEVIEEHLANEVQQLAAFVRQLLGPLTSPLVAVPLGVLAQVAPRLQALGELLLDYQPIAYNSDAGVG